MCDFLVARGADHARAAGLLCGGEIGGRGLRGDGVAVVGNGGGCCGGNAWGKVSACVGLVQDERCKEADVPYGALVLVRDTLEELRCRRAEVGCVGPIMSWSTCMPDVTLEVVEATDAE